MRGELVVFLVFLALVGSAAWWVWTNLRRDTLGSGAAALPARERAWLEERVLETFSSQDPSWEVRFTEGMARARFRCTYLNEDASTA